MARPPSTGVQDRRWAACELRLAGVGYVVIAQRLGYAGPSGAYAAVKAAMANGIEESATEDGDGDSPVSALHARRVARRRSVSL